MAPTFDVSTLFVADKAERTGAAQALASQSKNAGVALFQEIGLSKAIVNVSPRWRNTTGSMLTRPLARSAGPHRQEEPCHP